MKSGENCRDRAWWAGKVEEVKIDKREGQEGEGERKKKEREREMSE